MNPKYIKQIETKHQLKSIVENSNAIEPGTYDFKSDTLLSQLTCHLLVSL